MAENNNSGTNTVLIVILIIIVVGGLVWFLSGPSAENSDAGLNVDVTLPEGIGDTSNGTE
jgi:hypothetical protein